MSKKIIALFLCLLFMATVPNLAAVSAASDTNVKNYKKYYPEYQKHDKVLATAFLNDYNGSEAQALVARAIWYMENGYMIYGHSKYWDTGFIDCSNFVSLVYKDFGYNITSASRKYDQVGEVIEGVYSRKIKGSTRYRKTKTRRYIHFLEKGYYRQRYSYWTCGYLYGRNQWAASYNTY